MVHLFYQPNKLLNLVCLISSLCCAAATDEDIANFIENYLNQTVNVFLGGDANITSIFKTTVPKVFISIYKTDRNISQIKLDKTSGYIFVMEDNLELTPVLNNLRSIQGWNARQSYLLIHQRPVSKDLLKRSFSLLFKYNIYNVVGHHSGNTYYTWYPYDEGSECGTKVNLVKVEGFDPYQNKIPNVVKGCPINVTWPKVDLFLWDPFNKTAPGVLFLFFDVLAEKMNITVTYLKNNTNFFQSYINTGSVKILENDMRDRRIDLVIYGGVSGDTNLNTLDHSSIISQEQFFFVLPPRRETIRHNYYINMYDTKLTFSVVASLTISCVLWKLLTNQPLVDAVFDTFQLAVQVLITKTPVATRSRLFFASLLIFLYCLNAAYQSRLSSILTRPTYTPQIKSVRQLFLNSDVQVVHAFNNTLRQLYGIEELHEQLMKKWKVFPGYLGSKDLIRKFVHNQSEGIVISRYHMNYFRNSHELHVVYQEPVSLLITIIGARKGFPLLRTLNFWVNHMREAGLVDKYLRDTAMFIKKVDVASFVNNNSHVRLNLKHIEGALIIWAVGIITSFFVFLVEVFTISVFKRQHGTTLC